MTNGSVELSEARRGIWSRFISRFRPSQRAEYTAGPSIPNFDINEIAGSNPFRQNDEKVNAAGTELLTRLSRVTPEKAGAFKKRLEAVIKAAKSMDYLPIVSTADALLYWAERAGTEQRRPMVSTCSCFG